MRDPVVKAVIVTPAARDATLGNSITADRWAKILRMLGHSVSIATEWTHEDCDGLIALHARRSHASAKNFRQAHPDRPLIVALTGTDLYGDLPGNPEARQSLSMATRVVVLQSTALETLDESTRVKTSVIYQSAAAPAQRQQRAEDRFDVCVLSHLREVKDPLRAAFASRLLPGTSKMQIVHAGRALEAKWEEAARREQRENSRYRWVGEQSHETTIQLLACCRLFVLSSRMEGGANAIAEAVVCRVPVLCSDIPGNVGMLDREYPGYFRVGDTEQLAEMLYRAETDAGFLGQLRECVQKFQDRFAPEQEVACWRHLLQLLFSDPAA